MPTDADHPPSRSGADSDTFEALIAFVPRLAVELGQRPVPSWTSVEGSMLSADISGFTALSERLAGKGKAGAEEITSLINTCFTALIESAYRYGGEVIKFGGDALLILFRGENHERRSADAGLLMQRALHSSPAAKRAKLTMTVGIAAGPFDVFLVGSGYRELLITGPRATEVIRFEGAAAKGDTLVDPLIAEHLPDEMKLREEHGGWVITGSTGDAPSGPSERHLGHDDLSPYVPAAVVEQLAAFSDLGGEHRLVTVGFVMVVGLAEQLDRLGSNGVADALESIVDEVVAACDAYGVTVLHTDIAPDGLKFILCAGAPVSPGDTTDALLQAALAIAASNSPFVIRQGVQTGRVFAGFLGSPHRRTYTLMGDPVNTAARMLGKAEDRDIVAVAKAVADTRTVFETEELEPFLVKGKAEPITASKVLATSDEVRRDTTATRLFGRREELGVLGQAIGELGEVIVLSGVAGVGKSRLLDAAWDMAEGLHIFQAACTPYGATSPYSVFRPLLRVGSGIDLHADPATAGELLDKIVRQAAPSMLPWLPLLAVPFGAEVEPTPESDAVDPKFRRARIHDTVVDFLDTTLEGPVFLVVEDLHWIDDASGELLNHLIRAAGDRPWAGVLTRRPTGAWRPPDDVAHLRFLELEPLSDDDIRSLAIEISERALSDSDLTRIAARSGGNPLFAVELARALDRGTSAQLPDSIEGLIATRIDELPPEQRKLMRVAAVFGRDFDLDDVTRIMADTVAVGPVLDDMVEHEHGTNYRFRHAMYRDVAYEGLPYGRRKRLHAEVGRYLEAKAADPESIAGLLSLHFAAARSHPAAFRYASIAAADAAAAYAHQDAVEFYTRALTAGRYVRDVGAAQRAALLEQLGRSLEFSGQLSEADRVYTQLSRSTDDVRIKVDCLRRRARVRQKQNRLTAAVRLLGSAQQQLHRIGEEQSVDRPLAEIHLNLAGVRMDQGQLAQARAEAEAAERHALRAGDRGLEVQAYGAIVGATTDWEEAAPYAEKGFGGIAPPDAWEARYILGTNLGMAAYFAGRWGDAVDFYERGRAAAATMGNVTGAALASMNAAEILVDQGHLEPAVDALDQVRRVLGAAGYEAALLYAELLYATALNRLGRTTETIEMLKRCESEFRSGSMLLYALESLLRLAEATFVDGSPEIAEQLARQALGEARTVARSAVIEARAERLLGLVAAARGDRDSAREHLDSAVRTCRSGELRFELALALAARVGVMGDADEDDALEAADILRDLGVVDAGQPNPSRFWLPGLEPAG